MFVDRIIKINGEEFRILAVGSRVGSRYYCHLASLDNYRKHSNGMYPKQIADWIEIEELENAPLLSVRYTIN